MAASLVLASSSHQKSFVEALREGFRRGVQAEKTPAEIYEIDRDFEAFVAVITDRAGTITLPSGETVQKVPFDVFWLVEGKTFIGEASVRYKLSKWLIEAGGHIGYGIRPSFQRRGYGKLILKLALEKCRDYGTGPVLVTCNESNIGSAKIIEANGGVLEDLRKDPSRDGMLKRYWIEI